MCVCVCVCGEGHFLGLTCNAGDVDTRLQSAVYECDADDDVSDASDQFDDMMRNLGAVGLLEKFVHLPCIVYYTTMTSLHFISIAGCEPMTISYKIY